MINYPIKATMLIQIEKLAGDEDNKLEVTLKGGTKLVGYSLGIEPDEEKDCDVLAYECPDINKVLFLSNEDIVSAKIV